MTNPGRNVNLNPNPTLNTNYGQGQYNLTQNPKSILAERTHFHGENQSLRVTFANRKPGPRRNDSNASSQDSFNPVKKPVTPPPKQKPKSPVPVEELNKKLQFHDTVGPGIPVPGGSGGASAGAAAAAGHTENVPTSSGAAGNNVKAPTMSGAAGMFKAGGFFHKGVYKGDGTVDVLFPKTKNKPKLPPEAYSSSRAMLASSGKIKSEETVKFKLPKSVDTAVAEQVQSPPSPPKAKSRSRKLVRRATNKSLTSSASRKRSGRKIKRKKKSKSGQDLEEELKKPAELNEEYANEILKITKILKAVTAFDAATSTDGTTASPSANVTTFYKYNEGNGTTAASSVPSRSHPHRPLSGEELKQLLSSITRVVSLHQIPVDTAGKVTAGSAAEKPGTAKPNNEPNNPAAGTSDPPGIASMVSTIKGRRKKLRKAKRPQPKYPTFIEGSLSDPTYNRRKADASKGQKTKSKTSFVRKPLAPARPPPPKITKPPVKKKGSDSSISSLEQDPVKHAAFLRKYFEESLRLAAKKSSEDLVAANTRPDTATNPTPGPSVPPTAVPGDENSKKRIVKRKRSGITKDD